MNSVNIQRLVARLIGLRADILKKTPFYGRLLLNLSFGFADCQTAFTDMRRVVFDPKFAERLTDAELEFVLLHELMHCVLKHCTRSRGKQQYIYNIACDIVVNSLVFEAIGTDSLTLDGFEVMHTAPDSKEGREYTAGQVYEMLISNLTPEQRNRLAELSFDDHGIWRDLENGEMLEDSWNNRIATAARSCGTGSGMPFGLKRYFKKISHSPVTDWKQLLHDFICHDRCDYSFTMPDRRFSGDFVLPSFESNLCGDKVEKLYFYVDTSASVSDEALGEAYFEINSAIEQIGSISGYVAFFDTRVSELKPFESVNDLKEIEPVGGGGTSFFSVFDSLEGVKEDEKPCCIIIITDGYAKFPPESEARGIPVMWVIVESDVVPEWGVHIKI